jgi:hypothetical protein
MFYGAIIIIAMSWINCCSNRNQIDEHPIGTILSGGANLSKMGYTFLPPWTGFEVAVLMIGFVGLVLMRVSTNPSKSNN